MRHGFFCELAVCFIGVCYESHSTGSKDSRAVYLAPFCEMPGYDLFDVVCDMDPADVEGTVLSHKGPHAAHIVAVIAMLVPPEAVYVWVEEVVQAGESVKVFAFVAAWAEALGEEKAEVGSWDFVGPGVA